MCRLFTGFLGSINVSSVLSMYSTNSLTLFLAKSNLNRFCLACKLAFKCKCAATFDHFNESILIFTHLI